MSPRTVDCGRRHSASKSYTPRVIRVSSPTGTNVGTRHYVHRRRRLLECELLYQINRSIGTGSQTATYFECDLTGALPRAHGRRVPRLTAFSKTSCSRCDARLAILCADGAKHLADTGARMGLEDGCRVPWRARGDEGKPEFRVPGSPSCIGTTGELRTVRVYLIPRQIQQSSRVIVAFA